MRKYDEIIIDIPRKKKCVDDTVLWDEELAYHWWRVIDCLKLLGKIELRLIQRNFSLHKKN